MPYNVTSTKLTLCTQRQDVGSSPMLLCRHMSTRRLCTNHIFLFLSDQTHSRPHSTHPIASPCPVAQVTQKYLAALQIAGAYPDTAESAPDLRSQVDSKAIQTNRCCLDKLSTACGLGADLTAWISPQVAYKSTCLKQWRGSWAPCGLQHKQKTTRSPTGVCIVSNEPITVETCQ